MERDRKLLPWFGNPAMPILPDRVRSFAWEVLTDEPNGSARLEVPPTADDGSASCFEHRASFW